MNLRIQIINEQDGASRGTLLSILTCLAIVISLFVVGIPGAILSADSQSSITQTLTSKNNSSIQVKTSSQQSRCIAMLEFMQSPSAFLLAGRENVNLIIRATQVFDMFAQECEKILAPSAGYKDPLHDDPSQNPDDPFHEPRSYTPAPIDPAQLGLDCIERSNLQEAMNAFTDCALTRMGWDENNVFKCNLKGEDGCEKSWNEALEALLKYYECVGLSPESIARIRILFFRPDFLDHYCDNFAYGICQFIEDPTQRPSCPPCPPNKVLNSGRCVCPGDSVPGLSPNTNTPSQNLPLKGDGPLWSSCLCVPGAEPAPSSTPRVPLWEDPYQNLNCHCSKDRHYIEGFSQCTCRGASMPFTPIGKECECYQGAQRVQLPDGTSECRCPEGYYLVFRPGTDGTGNNRECVQYREMSSSSASATISSVSSMSQAML